MQFCKHTGKLVSAGTSLHENEWVEVRSPKKKSYKAAWKSVTWRVLAVINTLIICWITTGDWKSGLQIGVFSHASAVILYYLHERMWE